MDKLTMEQLGYAQQGVEGGVWQLFAEEGEMKMYRRELEEGGLVVDPLKAVHQVRGATAHEMVHHFWSPDVRFEWDSKCCGDLCMGRSDHQVVFGHPTYRK